MRNMLSGYGQSGMNPDEEELLSTVLGMGPPSAVGDVGAASAMPEQPPPAAPMDLQAPQPPVLGQQAGGLAGYTPPPAAKGPQLMDHVQERGFNPGDAAMLAAILGSLAFNKPEVSAAMAGQYGMDYSRQVENRDRQNQKIDMYNAELSAKDPELERWKLDQQAQSDYGNLSERKRGNDLEAERERRIAEAMAAENDPESAANKTRLTMAAQLAQARSKAELDTAQGRSNIHLSEEDKLAQLLGKGKYAAPKAAAGGKGGGAASTDPVKALKAREAAAKLAGIESGTYDPVTGKPVGDNGEKPLTPPQKLAREKYDALKTPIPGLEIDDDEAWAASVTTPGGREKIQKYWQGVQQTKNALGRMKKLREAEGAEIMGETKAAYDAAMTAAIGGFTQIGNSGVLNGGEFARYKEMIPGMAPRLADISRMLPGGEDQTVAELDGVISEVDSLAADGLRVAGVRVGSGGGKAAGGAAAAPRTNVTPGGKRLVTMKHSKTGKTDSQELDEAGIQRAIAKGWVLQ